MEGVSAVKESHGSDVEPGAIVNHGTKLDGVRTNPFPASAIPPLRSAKLPSMVAFGKIGLKTRVGLSRNPVRVSSTSLSFDGLKHMKHLGHLGHLGTLRFSQIVICQVYFISGLVRSRGRAQQPNQGIS